MVHQPRGVSLNQPLCVTINKKRLYLRRMWKKINVLLIFFVPFGVLAQELSVETTFVEHDHLHTYNFNEGELGKLLEEVNDSLKLWVNDSICDLPVYLTLRFSKTTSPQLIPVEGNRNCLAETLKKRSISFPDVRTLFLPQELLMVIRQKDSFHDSLLITKTKNLRIREKKQERALGSYADQYISLLKWAQQVEQLLELRELQLFHQKFDQAPPKKLNERMELLAEEAQFYPFKRTISLVQNAQLDYARFYLSQLLQFERRESLLYFFMTELNNRLQALKSEEEDLVRVGQLEGIAKVHTSNQAVIWTQLDTILSPLNSNYTTPEKLAWYQSNFPLRTRTIPPYSKQTAYERMIRQEKGNLFIDAESFQDDFERMGEIALILKDYAFARDYFWMLIHSEDHSENLEIYQFFYEFTLYEMGELHFEKQRDSREFRRYKKQLKKQMKRSYAYRTFK